MKNEEPVRRHSVQATLLVNVDLRRLDERPLDALRVLLVADVLRRVEEGRGGQPVLVAVGGTAGHPLRTAAEALGIQHPSLGTLSPAEADSLPGRPVEVTLRAAKARLGSLSPSSPGRRVLRIGEVVQAQGRTSSAGPDLLPADLDPLVLRLALLRTAYPSTAVLSPARLHRAEETLQRWRIKVAGWHDVPAPLWPNETSGWLAPLLADLDTPAVLRRLHRLELDPRLPSGRKHSAFTQADIALALDLRHLVGRRRP